MDECGLSFRYMLISLSITSQDTFDRLFSLMLMGIVYDGYCSVSISSTQRIHTSISESCGKNV